MRLRKTEPIDWSDGMTQRRLHTYRRMSLNVHRWRKLSPISGRCPCSRRHRLFMNGISTSRRRKHQPSQVFHASPFRWFSSFGLVSWRWLVTLNSLWSFAKCCTGPKFNMGFIESQREYLTYLSARSEDGPSLDNSLGISVKSVTRVQPE